MLIKTVIILTAIGLANASCRTLLSKLAYTQSEFIHCVTIHSVPVTMCISCVDAYTELLHSYDILSANCSSSYFDKDRINIVASVETALTGVWSKAYCDYCFNNNNSDTFIDKNSTLYRCLNSNGSNPCEECKVQYLDLNSFYISLDQHNNGEVCFDLQDSMNRTRDTWSKRYKCCRREKNMTLFAIVLSIISCLPMLFYGSTYFITKYQERNHGILNNEDSIYISPLPSSSRRYDNIHVDNVIQPVATQTLISSPLTASANVAPTQGPLSSNAAINDIDTILSIQKPDKNRVPEFDEESSDDNMDSGALNHYNKKLNIFK